MLALTCAIMAPVDVNSEGKLIENPPLPPQRPQIMSVSPAFFERIKEQMVNDYDQKISDMDARNAANIQPAAGSLKQNSGNQTVLELEQPDSFDILDFVENLGLEQDR